MNAHDNDFLDILLAVLATGLCAAIDYVLEDEGEGNK